MILLSNQHAALHKDSIGPPLAVARIPHNQEAGPGLVGGVGYWCWDEKLALH